MHEHYLADILLSSRLAPCNRVFLSFYGGGPDSYPVDSVGSYCSHIGSAQKDMGDIGALTQGIIGRREEKSDVAKRRYFFSPPSHEPLCAAILSPNLIHLQHRKSKHWVRVLRPDRRLQTAVGKSEK